VSGGTLIINYFFRWSKRVTNETVEAYVSKTAGAA
jgi:hypothetical protein